MGNAVSDGVALDLSWRHVHIAYQAVVIAEGERQDIGGAVVAQEPEIQLLDLGIREKRDGQPAAVLRSYG